MTTHASMHAFASAVALAALLTGCGDSADDTGTQPNDRAFRATLTELEQAASELEIPGIAVAIVIDGRLAYQGGVGVRGRSSSGIYSSDAGHHYAQRVDESPTE
jgi:CubicO group peptidase (beta-lactamase class C family)